MDTGEKTNCPKEKTNCCGVLVDIVNLQDEGVQLLTKVVGSIPTNESLDEPEPIGSLGVIELNLRTVERRMRILVKMLNDLHDRV